MPRHCCNVEIYTFIIKSCAEKFIGTAFFYLIVEYFRVFCMDGPRVLLTAYQVLELT